MLGRLIGWYVSIADFAAQHTLDPTRLYLLGRGTTALLGTLTVWVVYELGQRAYNRRAGLLAAWFLAVSFLHIRDSHYAVNDIPATFLVTLALLGAVRIVDTGAPKWYALTGAALGLGFVTKYTAALAVVPASIAHFFAPDVHTKTTSGLKLRRLLIMPLIMGISAIFGSPYFVITPGKVFRDIYEALYLPGKTGFDGWEIDPAGGYVFYIKCLAWGLGWGLLLVCGSGLLTAPVRRSPKGWVLLLFPVLMYASLGHQKMYFARYILPVIPVSLALGAALLERSASVLAQSKRAAPVALVVAALLLTLQPLAASLRSDFILSHTDVRDIAKTWIEEHIAEGAKIATDWPVYGPPISSPERQFANSTKLYDVTVVSGKGLSENPANWYREQGFDYVVASSFIYNIPLVDEVDNAERHEFYSSLDQQFMLIRAFYPNRGAYEPPYIFDEVYGPAISVWDRERPGPVLMIYEVTPQWHP